MFQIITDRTLSGNLLKEAAIRNVEDIAIRREVAVEIAGVIKRKRLNAASLAALLDVTEYNAAGLMRGEFGKYTLEQLLLKLNLLGQDVAISFMKASPKRAPKISVHRV